ncbi:hypothetical protein RIR_jg23040.t1 [Rhizophagus irregularis DAOM 181602=DAOM 197198]|nr:hypothetical protein RIR_jg23040.t1 [Rhizophagus irregularis DAOM 181602=DAOM 197198]
MSLKNSQYQGGEDMHVIYHLCMLSHGRYTIHNWSIRNIKIGVKQELPKESETNQSNTHINRFLQFLVYNTCVSCVTCLYIYFQLCL